MQGAPDDTGGDPFSPPDAPPPTGSKWQGIEVEGDCGRTYRTWVLVDEVCGGTDDPGYTDAFHVPMFRDGALVGSTLFAVDGSALWALDVTDPAKPARRALFTGVGEPVAAASDDATLLLAAASEGLVVLDVATPDAPVETARVDLGGPALDVVVDGGFAYVAAGAAGVAVVDLAQSPAALVKTLPVPGFAAGVAVQGGVAYVAACGTFAVVDVATGALLGQAWFDDAVQDGLLLAPARDVAVVGDVAFVAAGRYGAVAIDVADPKTPKILGNCSIPGDPSFYASGVRASAGTLFVAGGEWGIMPVSTADPHAACTSYQAPALPELPSDEQACSAEPPWRVLPWQTTWAPPPPGKDPIQTLPAGDVVYAFGDARRVGFRAVDARATGDGALALVGRYAEPRVAISVAAHGGKVLVLGSAGGLYQRDEQSLLVPVATTIQGLDKAVAGALLDDGRWAIATADQQLVIEGSDAPVAIGAPVFEHGLRAAGSTITVPIPEGALVFDAAAKTTTLLDSGAVAELPAAVLPTADGVVVAAPEWVNAITVRAGGAEPLAPHGAFDEHAILDVRAWLRGLPRRLLAASDAGVVEVASLGQRVTLALHGAAPASIELPPGTYVDAAGAGGRVHLVAVDRGRYQSLLVTVSVSKSGPSITSIESFTGVASGVAIDGDRLYVADADRGVRVYDATLDEPALLGVVDLEVAP